LAESERTIRDELERAESRLKDLERESAEFRARIKALREQLASPLPRTPYQIAPPARTAVREMAPADKVSLFCQLFRGRDDMFARLWVNQRKQTKGYAPACANEWVRRVCEKPRVKCGECPNQAFLKLDAQAILGHLRGRHVIGVYPLLPDETCWFLAVDFDGEAWNEDVAAFRAACESVGIPPAVERSRSGNGAHCWFFFAAPVAAATARKLGSFVITEAMAHRHQLSMASHDRLFPKQDTMPRGGFGNSIALPLQHEAGQKGYTLFLDEQGKPHNNQWAYLSSVPRIELGVADRLVAEASRRGQILGVRGVGWPEDEEEFTPWTRPPPRPWGPASGSPSATAA
jgi:hypothetical protein